MYQFFNKIYSLFVDFFYENNWFNFLKNGLNDQSYHILSLNIFLIKLTISYDIWSILVLFINKLT